jgi:hypothetical protein
MKIISSYIIISNRCVLCLTYKIEQLDPQPSKMAQPEMII